MSFTQYPRPGDVTDYAVPSGQLERLVRWGLLWGGLGLLADLILWIFTLTLMQQERWDDVNQTAIPVYLMALVSAIVSIAFAVVVFQWVHLAWKTCLGLRQMDSRLTPKMAAWLCVIPFVNPAGLNFVLDFLAVRSRSKDAPTMKWWSIASGDPLATAFAYAMALHFALTVFQAVPRIAKKLGAETLPYGVADFLAQAACFWLGYLISRSVNLRLRQSVPTSDTLNESVGRS